MSELTKELQQLHPGLIVLEREDGKIYFENKSYWKWPKILIFCCRVEDVAGTSKPLDPLHLTSDTNGIHETFFGVEFQGNVKYTNGTFKMTPDGDWEFEPCPPKKATHVFIRTIGPVNTPDPAASARDCEWSESVKSDSGHEIMRAYVFKLPRDAPKKKPR